MQKTVPLFLLVVLLKATSLLSQNNSIANEKSDDEIILVSSPLMMFGGEEKNPLDKNKTSSNQEAEQRRQTEQNDLTGESSSSQAARGNLSTGIAEEAGDDGSLTLDHFRAALAANPTATRFVINEDEERGISLDPRAAGTSKFALSKNKAENTTIIDALRELLVTRHGGSSALVNSFFDASINSGDAPLGAERLGEILRRSDEAQKTMASQKTTSQKPCRFKLLRAKSQVL